MKSKKNSLTNEARRQDVSVLTVIRRALERTDGNVSEAARLLKCSTQAIYYHLHQTGATMSRTVVKP